MVRDLIFLFKLLSTIKVALKSLIKNPFKASNT